MGYEIDDSDFYVAFCEGLYGDGEFKDYPKMSYHIVINSNIYFKSVDDIKIFKSYAQEFINNEKYKDLELNTKWKVDFAVYGINQNFKLPFNSKANNNYYQKPINNDYELHDFLISYDKDNFKGYKIIKVKQIEETIEKRINKIRKEKNIYSIPTSSYNTIIDYDNYLSKINKELWEKKWIPTDLKYETLLKNIYNGEGLPYGIYRAVGSAIKRITKESGFKYEYGLKLFQEWCVNYPNNNIAENESQYEGYNENRCGYTTLLNLANLCNPQVANYNNDPLNFILKDDMKTSYLNYEVITPPKRYIEISNDLLKNNKNIFIQS